jgi:hypothetical protein
MAWQCAFVYDINTMYNQYLNEVIPSSLQNIVAICKHIITVPIFYYVTSKLITLDYKSVS